MVGTRKTAVAVSVLILLSMLAAQQRQPRASVQSPHGNLNMPCENCHTFTSWKPIRAIPDFNHNQTKYPLRGMHAGVTCRQCHSSLVFNNVGTKCADCHADIHRRQMGANCESCHTVKGWNVSLRAISQHQNRFPLVAAHATLDCESCHTGAATGQFLGLSTQCFSCHQKDFQTPVLDHKALGFPTDCTVCHTMNSWFGAKFDHGKFTNFPLTGMHATLDCQACHTNNNFQLASTACYSCHAKDYNGTTNPNHVQAAFPQNCALCHSTSAWQPATFNHSTTKFPLTGMHTTVQCAQCHVNNNYTNLPTDCASCHMNDYNGTTNPNHKASGFPTDCSICHTTQGWQLATFNHSTTGFPLTGFHTSLPCATCHTNGNFNITVSTCVSCHQNDYNNTNNPNHASAGFPTTCDVCHTTTAWTPASFDHSKTAFPLTGAHVNVACAKCHINNVFAGTPTDCYSCHKADYTGVTNPNHVAAQFPTTCTTCHNTTSWLGATFNHTWFPIYSGTHAGKWTTCADCHVNAADYSAFSCITCHQHSQSVVAPEHQGVRNFVYGPTTCYTCHPTGNGG